MKGIICPMSSHRIEEHIPRIVALLVVATLILYISTGFLPIMALLALDFYQRGFKNGKYSTYAFLAKRISTIAGLKSKAIDKAPKVFAARLGFIFTILIAALHILQLNSIASIAGVGLALFAGLECALNFCVGCYLYTYIILPFNKAKSI